MEKYNKFDLNKLKKEFNLDDAAIETCGFTEQELQEIYADYLKRKDGVLEKYKNDFVSEYILSAKDIRFHSYSGRVKDAYHLMEKIIRKRNNKDSKYAKMKVDDYYKYITDLIGCRILLVYKSDWLVVHKYLTKIFPNDSGKYIDGSNYVEGYLRAEEIDSDPYMAERPVVYIRAGDEESLYSGVEDIDLNRKGYYRSVHYIVRYREYYVEIQVRSLFEEAWGEVDHDVLYPLYKDSEELVGFSTLLNRAAGMGDEMSAYFKDYAKKGAKIGKNQMLDTPNIFSASRIEKKEKMICGNEKEIEEDEMSSTPGHELERLLSEW